MKKAAPSPATKSPPRPPAQQKRSRKTFDKLIAATLRVLDRDGLDGATVPRIAAEARLSPASIYRRFADKDDLLRATLLRVLQAAHDTNAAHLRTLVVQDDLSATADGLIAALLKQHREHPHLPRALAGMTEAEPDSAFTKEVLKLNRANIAHAVDTLLAHRDSIRHPDLDRAARFAVLSAMTAIEQAASSQSSLWHAALPLSDKAFAAELSRQMMGYLRRKP